MISLKINQRECRYSAHLFRSCFSDYARFSFLPLLQEVLTDKKYAATKPIETRNMTSMRICDVINSCVDRNSIRLSNLPKLKSHPDLHENDFLLLTPAIQSAIYAPIDASVL